jgi:hypothetical protein
VGDGEQPRKLIDVPLSLLAALAQDPSSGIIQIAPGVYRGADPDAPEVLRAAVQSARDAAGDTEPQIEIVALRAALTIALNRWPELS